MKSQRFNAVLKILMIMATLQIFQFNAYADETGGNMAIERNGVATMKGKPITLLGDEIKAGQKAPDFLVQATDLSDARLSDFKGKVKLIATVVSLDTPVCDMESRRFNEEASRLSDSIAIFFISMDLPFAQKRFCSAADINNVKALSDHRSADFGLKYGVLIKDMRLLSRAIFIIDKDDNVRYVEYVSEQGQEPNYAAALKALGEIAKK